jgi:hypothetical protein
MIPTSISTDLYRPIVSYVTDRTSLLALLLSSRILRIEAERILYDTFCTHNWQHGDHVWREYPISRQLGFLNRVAASDRVASYVHNVNMEQFNDWGQDDVVIFWDVFERALRRMRNLKQFGMCKVYVVYVYAVPIP